ncbi:MAG: hypothetical protein JXB29_12005 [Sedimentisphaerales bacterium]|nr:hypothetical protein [Sedimentisphaerales bacterium]
MSPRELEVAKLVCQGLNNKEISKDLEIRSGTVKTHIRNIYRRIHVDSKIAMLLKFVDDARRLSGRPDTGIPIVEIKK